jgi:hypothetical protein
MNITTEKVTINELLGVPNRQLRVPPFQRPYAWQSEQVDELWDDIIRTLGRGHFMGVLVLNWESPESPEIIDGQQRLITLILMLGLLRDQYAAAAVRAPRAATAVGRIQQFLENTYRDGEARFKLRVGDANWPVFRDFVLKAPEDTTRKQWSEVSGLSTLDQQRNQALLDNARRLKEKLSSYSATCRDDGERLEKYERLEKAIVGSLEFVVLKVAPIDDAFVLFETLNDRGLALSAGDLLKNLILASAAASREAIEEYAREWDSLLASLRGADVTTFLRHYLLIHRESVIKDDVYRHFREDVRVRGARLLVPKLREAGELYGQFHDPTGGTSSEVRRVLTDLRTLRATMCYTALLPARRHLDDQAFVAYARLAEILTFRYSTICGKDAKSLERAYHESVHILAESRGAALAKARRALVDELPSGDEFVQAFRRQTMGREYVADYLLRKLEDSFDREELQVRERGPVHIEHIMPLTLNDDWRDCLGARLEEHAVYVNRWGNLTLLGGKRNIAASNQPFDRKREIYRTSRFTLTKRLTEHDRWDLGAIETRQDELARLSDRLWSVDRRA